MYSLFGGVSKRTMSRLASLGTSCLRNLKEFLRIFLPETKKEEHIFDAFFLFGVGKRTMNILAALGANCGLCGEKD